MKIPLKKGQSIVFDGDSNTNRRMLPSLDTWPFLRLSNWHITYADRVAEWIFCHRPDLQLNIHNAGVGGANCRGILERQEAFVLPHKPDWVFLTIGNNDSPHQVPLKEFREKLSEYCLRLRKASGGKVIFVSGNKPCPHIATGKVEAYRKRAVYHRIAREVIRKFGGTHIDFGLTLQKKARELHRWNPCHTVYSYHDNHFNLVGAEIIAGIVLKSIGLIRY